MTCIPRPEANSTGHPSTMILAPTLLLLRLLLLRVLLLLGHLGVVRALEQVIIKTMFAIRFSN